MSYKLREIHANHIFNKGLISIMYKDLPKLNNKKSNNPVKKQTKYLNRHITKDL